MYNRKTRGSRWVYNSNILLEQKKNCSEMLYVLVRFSIKQAKKIVSMENAVSVASSLLC